jgi:hypothetical protein
MNQTASETKTDLNQTNLSASEPLTDLEVLTSQKTMPSDISTSPRPKTKLDEIAEAENKRSKMAWKPGPGFTWNPLLKIPRNRQCPCLSGKKFKVCCLDTLPRVVSEKDAKQYAEQMAKLDLVFLTKENEEKVKRIISPQVKSETERMINAFSKSKQSPA